MAALALVLGLCSAAAVRCQEPLSQPRVLNNPFADQDFVPLSQLMDEPDPGLRWPVDPPAGYSGPSGISPSEEQENSHFVPVEDRWRIGMPEYDRYDQGHPRDFE